MIHFYKDLTLREFELDPKDYMKYVEEFHKTLGFNIRYLEKPIVGKVVSTVSDFVIALYTKPRKSFLLKLDELTGWSGYLLFKQKRNKYIEPEREVKKILSVLMTIPSFVAKAKRVKDVTDQLYAVVGDGGLFKSGELIFKMDKLEGFVQKALDDLKEMSLDVVYSKDKNIIIVPYSNMIMRDISTREIVMMTSTVLSVFKFLYALNSSGDDLVKSMNLRGDFEKWKKTRLKELEVIDNRLKTLR